MATKIKEVEIGLLNRDTKEVFLTTVESNRQIYYSIGSSFDWETEGEYVMPIYAFESNAMLFTLPDGKSDATIERTFLKKYKILRPGAVSRFKKDGSLTEIDGDLFLID